MDNNCTCNYNESCLQPKQNPLRNFSRQNLSEQTKSQQLFFLGIMFSISLVQKKNPATTPTPNLRVQQQLL